MNLLIVEDDPQLRQLLVAELHKEAQTRGVELIIAAEDNLGGALLWAHWCDGILCDGEFWDRPNPAARRLDNYWPVLRDEARRMKSRFVLYTGSDDQADALRRGDYGVAIAKPAPAHLLAEAIF